VSTSSNWYENFTAPNRYIPSFAINVGFKFYLNIRWQNWVSMESLIPQS
jgi:hypothetical protein